MADFDYSALTVTRAPTVRDVPESLQHPRRLRPGDLLIEKSGGGDRQNVGRVVRFDGDGPAIYSNFIALLRPAPDFDARYLAYLHRSLYLQGVASATTKQTTGIQNLDLGAYLSTVVQLRSDSRQRAIADFLDRECERLEELESSAQALTVLNDRHLVSVRHSLLLGHELDTALAEGNWPPGWWRLAHLVDSWYAGGTPDSGDASYWTDDEQAPEWISIGDMSGRRIVGPGSRRVTRDGVAAGRLRLPPPGTLLLAMYASVGEVAELEREAYFNQALIGLHIVDPVQRGFVHEWLLLIRPHLPWFTKSSTQPNLSAEIVRHIPIPPIEIHELQPTLRTLESVRTDTARVNEEIVAMARTLVEYRDALITEAVTGKLDVTGLSEQQLDESAHAALEGEQPEVLA